MRSLYRRARAWALRAAFRAADRLAGSERGRRICGRYAHRLMSGIAQLGLTDKARMHSSALSRQAEKFGLLVPRLLSISPHNVRLYEYFIRRHLAEGAVFITSETLYAGQPLDPAKAYVLLRHDVDYTPESLHLFTDIERRCGVRSDIYVILDNRHYDIGPYVQSYGALAREGFCLGLHTLAPVRDDFYSALREEVRVFETTFGAPPRFFTIHGPPSPPERPPNWSEIRQNFIAKIQRRQASFGFAGSHNFGGVDRWLEDSGVGGELSYLSMDWAELKAEKGRVLGVLAHPDHWTEWPVRWRVDPASAKEHPAIADFVKAAPMQRN
jgi:hypothetical protein